PALPPPRGPPRAERAAGVGGGGAGEPAGPLSRHPHRPLHGPQRRLQQAARDPVLEIGVKRLPALPSPAARGTAGFTLVDVSIALILLLAGLLIAADLLMETA